MNHIYSPADYSDDITYLLGKHHGRICNYRPLPGKYVPTQVIPCTIRSRWPVCFGKHALIAHNLQLSGPRQCWQFQSNRLPLSSFQVLPDLGTK